jgi:hypothetical protein
MLTRLCLRASAVGSIEGAFHPEFSERYARERQADFLAAQVVEIADTVPEGKKIRIGQKDGTTEEHADIVEQPESTDRETPWLIRFFWQRTHDDTQ